MIKPHFLSITTFKSPRSPGGRIYKSLPPPSFLPLQLRHDTLPNFILLFFKVYWLYYLIMKNMEPTYRHKEGVKEDNASVTYQSGGF